MTVCTKLHITKEVAPGRTLPGHKKLAVLGGICIGTCELDPGVILTEKIDRVCTRFRRGICGTFEHHERNPQDADNQQKRRKTPSKAELEKFCQYLTSRKQLLRNTITASQVKIVAQNLGYGARVGTALYKSLRSYNGTLPRKSPSVLGLVDLVQASYNVFPEDPDLRPSSLTPEVEAFMKFFIRHYIQAAQVVK